jgi:hypothetical protein
LTELLFDYLQVTPYSRVVYVSALAHEIWNGHLDFDDLMYEKRNYESRIREVYASSKLANIMHAKHL